LEVVVIVGEVACTMCRESVSVTPRTGGEATELAGHRITICRKQPDGCKRGVMEVIAACAMIGSILKFAM
jgi:hypothetical protein